MSHSRENPQRVSDETARRLLERAATLDQSALTLGQLREAALEAGISTEAFDAAVDEWRRVDRPTGLSQSKDSWPTRVLRNMAGIAAGWAAVGTVFAIERLAAAPELPQKLSEPMGLAIGAVIAAKLRARTAVVVLSGLALSQGAEFVMDLVTGTPPIHGRWAHLALMAAGVAGVWLGSRLRRRPGAPPDSDPASADGPLTTTERHEQSSGSTHVSRAVVLNALAS